MNVVWTASSASSREPELMEAVAEDLSGVALVEIAGGVGARSDGSLDAGCPTYRWFCGHLSSCCGPSAPPGGARNASVGSPGRVDDPRTRGRYARTGVAPSSRRSWTKSASSASGGLRLNSSKARQVSRTSSQARSAPARRSVVPSSVEEVEPVGVDDGALGADGHDDQVAVPGRELLQRGEQLVPLGAAGCPTDALLGLAGREVERSSPSSAFRFASAPHVRARRRGCRCAAAPGSNSGSV